MNMFLFQNKKIKNIFLCDMNCTREYLSYGLGEVLTLKQEIKIKKSNKLKCNYMKIYISQVKTTVAQFKPKSTMYYL